jgi:amidase
VAAQALRQENNRRLAEVFGRVDVLVTPTTPAGPHGHDGPGPAMNVSLTWAFNLSGHPAVTVPAGFSVDGTPVGMQLVARPGEEETLLRIAAAAERLTG